MKLLGVFLLFLLGVSSISASLNRLIFGEYKEGQRFIFMPNGEGKPQLVDLHKEDPDYRYDAEKTVKFILHRRAGKGQIIYGNDESLESSLFDKTKPVKIVIHGWTNDGNSEVNKLIKDAFLANADLNVVVVDWKKGSNTLYTSAVKNVLKVGALVGKFVDWLVVKGTPISAFHIIGHSLGAHISGVAGRSVTKGTVPYITGLDPAGPLWGKKSQRIRSTDAAYVEAIHTDSGDLGLKEQVGDTDFYPNKGDGQPGCAVVSCSHARSYKFFADSIDHKGFMAMECTDYKEMSKGKCKNLSQLHMGGSSPKNAKGLFYLETNKKKPYYKG